MYGDDLMSGSYRKEEVIDLKRLRPKYFNKVGSHCINGTQIVVSNPTKNTMKI